MYGIAMQGGWHTVAGGIHEYSLSLFDSAEKLFDFYDILTRDRWGYLAQYRANELVVLPSHVTDRSGPADFNAIMRHAESASVTSDTVMNFAFVRVALGMNPSLRGVLLNQENWWGLKTLPCSYMRPLLATSRVATPLMLTRVYERGIPVEYVTLVPFFEEDDYYRVYDAGVTPQYIRQFMFPTRGADLETSHVSFSVPIDNILLGWENGIPAEYLKEAVTT